MKTTITIIDGKKTRAVTYQRGRKIRVHTMDQVQARFMRTLMDEVFTLPPQRPQVHATPA